MTLPRPRAMPRFDADTICAPCAVIAQTFMSWRHARAATSDNPRRPRSPSATARDQRCQQPARRRRRYAARAPPRETPMLTRARRAVLMVSGSSPSRARVYVQRGSIAISAKRRQHAASDAPPCHAANRVSSGAAKMQRCRPTTSSNHAPCRCMRHDTPYVYDISTSRYRHATRRAEHHGI